MRYLKVFLGVVLFYVVVLFFVQNHDFLSQTMPLKFDLMFIPAQESLPVPQYALMLICFLIGALCTLSMLIWDRITISTSLAVSNRKVKGVEKELAKAKINSDAYKAELEAAKLNIAELEEKQKELQSEIDKAKEIATKRANAFDVSFDDN